ncbi:MAG TPA: radical SAM protein [Candidatus Binatia bacterium]|nr:radical SAM protein [Candidatus Binatia bacterium]
MPCLQRVPTHLWLAEESLQGIFMRNSLRAFSRVFRTPVSSETRKLLQVTWERLPEHLRTPNQFLGRQYVGCGATIGAMPRCDFACRGCYLGTEANHIPAQSVEEIKRQLRRIRAWLGEGGNVQLTDGEVILRLEAEVIELIRYARAIGLVPMLMTHGDLFRRRPKLLKRLMVEGGLTEISIHIDTTQRGRRGPAYKHATREEALLPLRDEFAEIIRRARRETGLTLDAATTFTVTRENLAGVPVVIRWLCRNADAFKMISFQPVAQVGRTEEGLGGSVTVDEVWMRIAEGLYGDAAEIERLLQHKGWLGHPACSRFVQGVVMRQPGEHPRFHPLFRSDDPQDQAVIQGWMARFGGLTCRLDTKWQATARLAGVFTENPEFLICKVLPFLLRWPQRFDPAHPVRLVWRWLRGTATVHYLNLVSHHFMSQAELATPRGQERLALCVFQVPVGDRMVSMCEVNAGGVRERYYAALRARRGMTESL